MSKVNVPRAMRLVPTIELHIKQYGSNPDFSVFHTDKNRKKIHNYVKSAAAIPNMTMDEAIYIASHISIQGP
jgi:hypothetical protein